MTWIVAQVGSREHYGAAVALHRRSELTRLLTDVWWPWRSPWTRHLPGRAGRIGSRSHPELPPHLVRARNLASGVSEAQRLASGVPVRRDQANAGNLLEGSDFARWVAGQLRRTDRHGASVLMTYCTAALEAIEAGREAGMTTVVDQFDGADLDEAEILMEIDRWPGWQRLAGTLSGAYIERLMKEWNAADFVVVNSSWSAKAVIRHGVDAAKIKVIPLGYDFPLTRSLQPRERAVGPVRVLWLGSVILRKGIQYLVEAARSLPASEFLFTIAGPIGISEAALRSAPSNVRFVGPVGPERAAALYRGADVFVLPTLADGFGITQLEAMSYGLPVIATPRCGEVVTDGIDGFIVAPRDARALATALAWFAQNPNAAIAMGAAAVVKAKEFSLDRFGEVLSAISDPTSRG